MCVGTEYMHICDRHICVYVCRGASMHVHWRPEDDLSVHSGALSFFFEMESVIALELPWRLLLG